MLFTHQVAGAEWLASRKKAYLGDTCGLGKTRTLLAGLKAIGNTNTLVVCPAIVRSHWAREAEVLGLGPIVKSYDEVTRGGMRLMSALIRDGVDTLICDEAHYLKTPTAQRTKLILGRDGYARRIERVWLASGTPMPKNPAEMWTVLASCFPWLLRDYGVTTRAEFLARYCVVRGRMMRGRWIEKVVGVKNEAELREMLGVIMLRRTLDDVGLDVPPLWWQTVRLDGGGDIIADDDDVLTRTWRAVAHGELASIANDPHVARMRRRIGELKAPLVVEMLKRELAESDEKVVVMAHHRSVLNTLYDGLFEFGPCYIDGDTSPAERASEIDDFQTHAGSRVFIGQQQACMTGVTLTAARRVVLVEPAWTAVENEQAGYRVARIGQQAGTCVAQMVCLSGTLDEAIVGQCAREVKMSQAVFS